MAGELLPPHPAMAAPPFFRVPEDGGASLLPILYEKFELASVQESLQEAVGRVSSPQGSSSSRRGGWRSWRRNAAVSPALPATARRSLAVSADGQRAAVVFGATLTVLESSSNFEDVAGVFSEPQAEGSRAALQHATWSEDGSLLAVFNPAKGAVHVLDKNAQLIQTIPRREWRKEGVVVGLAIRKRPGTSSVRSHEVLLVSKNATLFKLPIGDSASKEASVSLRWQHRRPVSCVAFHPQKALLAVVGPTASAEPPFISLWQLEDGPKFKCNLLCVSAISGPNRTLGKDVLLDGSPPVSRFSPGGQGLAVVDELGKVHVWQLQNSDAWSFHAVPWKGPEEGVSLKVEEAVDVAWWGEEALAVALKGGQVALQTVPEGFSLLGSRPELFEAEPRLCWAGNGCLLVLETQLCAQGGQENEGITASPSESTSLLPWLLGTAYASGSRREGSDDYSPDDESAFHGWRLVSLVQRSPEEMMKIHLAEQEYGAALTLAAAYGLDSDVVYKERWRLSDCGRHSIRDNLMRVHDLGWLLEECLGHGPRTAEAAAALLHYGLQETQQFIEQGSSDIALIREGLMGEEAEERLWWFRRQRLRLLQYRERLETYMAVSMGRFVPADYYNFRDESLLAIALLMAQAGKCAALDLLLRRHTHSLAPCLLTLLDSLPELLPPKSFQTLLPGPTPPSLATVRRTDWVESTTTLEAIAAGRGSKGPISASPREAERREAVPLQVCTEELVRLGQGLLWPSPSEVEEWYRRRAAVIEEQTGRLEHSVGLLDLGVQRGMVSLTPLLEDMADMHAAVYGGAPNLTWQRWQGMGVYSRFELLLEGANAEDVGERLHERALPLLLRWSRKLPSSSTERSSSALLSRWLDERAREGKLEVCTAVLKGQGWDRLGMNAEDVMEIGLRCCYAFPSVDHWKQVDELLAVLLTLTRTAASAPGENRGSPRGLRSALHRRAQQLPMEAQLTGAAAGEEAMETHSDIHQRVIIASGHLRAAKLLSKYHVAQPMAFFLQLAARRDVAAAKDLLRRLLAGFSRRQPPPSEGEWGQLWGALCSLQTEGFPFLLREQLLAEYCRGLLHAGCFEAAGGPLKQLAGEESEQLVIEAARHWFYSSTSHTSADVERARQCLALIPDSAIACQEAELVSAIVDTLPNMGVELLPLQVRQMGSPMALIAHVLTASPTAFLDPPAILKLARQIGLENDSAVLAAVARHAAGQGETELARTLCLQLLQRRHGDIWDLCAALGRGPEEAGLPLSIRAKLLGFALAHCDEESLLPLLRAWSGTDTAERCGELGLVAAVAVPTLKDEEQLLAAICGGIKHLGGGDEVEDRLEIGQVALSQVSGDVDKERKWSLHTAPKELLVFACLHLPWLLASYPPEDTNPASEVMRGQIASVVLHTLASFQVAPADRLLIDMAKAAMGEGLRYGEGRDGDSVGLGYALHAADAGEAAALLEMEMERRKEHSASRRALAMSLYHCAVQALLLQPTGIQPWQAQQLLQASPLELAQQLARASEEGVLDQEGAAEWVEKARQAETKLRASDDARLLQEVLPEADPHRFAARDKPYMETMILSLVGSHHLGVPDMLSHALSLAEHYGVDSLQVHLAHVEALLLSDWQTDEVEAEVSSQEDTLLANPLQFVKLLQKSVLPQLSGSRHARLAYCFSLLSQGYRSLQKTHQELNLKEQLPTALFPAESSLAERLAALKTYEHECLRLSEAAPRLDFLRCVQWHESQCSEALGEIEAHLTPANVDTLAGLAAHLAELGHNEASLLPSQEAIYLSLVRSMWSSSLQERQSSSFDGYGACRRYLCKLKATDLKEFLQVVVKDSISAEDPPLLLWEAVVEDAMQLLGPNSAEEDKARLVEAMASLRACRSLLEGGRISPSQARAAMEAVDPLRDNGAESVKVGAATMEAMIANGCSLLSILNFMETVYGPWKPLSNPAIPPPAETSRSRQLTPVATSPETSKPTLSHATSSVDGRSRLSSVSLAKRKGRGGGKLGVVRISNSSGAVDGSVKGSTGAGKLVPTVKTESEERLSDSEVLSGSVRQTSLQPEEKPPLPAAVDEPLPTDLHALYAAVSDRALATDNSEGLQAVEGAVTSLKDESSSQHPPAYLRLLRTLRSSLWRRLCQAAADVERKRISRIQLLQLLEIIAPDLEEIRGIKQDRWTPNRRLSRARDGGGKWGRWAPEVADMASVDEVDAHIGPAALLLMRSAEAVVPLWPDIELVAQDVASTVAAEALFVRLHSTATSAEHTAALLNLLDIWGEVLHGRSQGGEEGSERAHNDEWGDGWGALGGDGEERWPLHPLHRCWAMLLPGLLLGEGKQVLRAMAALDAAAPHLSSDLALLTEGEAQDVLERIQCKRALAAKVALLLPYRKLHSSAIRWLQDAMKNDSSCGDAPLSDAKDVTVVDREVVLLVLASGVLPMLAAETEHVDLLLAVLHALGPLVRQRQEHLAAQSQSHPQAHITGRRVEEQGAEAGPLFALALPCAVAELTVVRQYGLASSLAEVCLRVHPGLAVWSTALPLLARFLVEQLRGGAGTEGWTLEALQQAEPGLEHLRSARQFLHKHVRAKLDTAFNCLAEDMQ